MNADAENLEVTNEEAKGLLSSPEKPQRESYWKIFTKGIVLENPVLILMIGICPTLATSSTASDAAGMSAAVLFVLVLSNVFVSLMRKLIPNEVRIPVFIVIISTFVTIIDYIMHAYQPDLYAKLGIFVPLIVVNCIILGRAEGFAYTNNVWASFLDGMGKSFGFTLTIVVMGTIRELLGAGTWFKMAVLPEAFRKNPVVFFAMAPGAFLCIGLLKALINKVFKRVG